MSKRVSNKKGVASKLPFSKRPARSTRTWLRHLAKKRWARRQEQILNRRIEMREEVARRLGDDPRVQLP